MVVLIFVVKTRKYLHCYFRVQLGNYYMMLLVAANVLRCPEEMLQLVTVPVVGWDTKLVLPTCALVYLPHKLVRRAAMFLQWQIVELVNAFAEY